MSFRFNEKYLSQIPALQLLINLGYEYLPPDRALAALQGKTGNVLLETILADQLKKINQIRHKGREFLFSEENIQSAVQKLKNIKYDGLLKTNETVYDLLTLGTALEQTIEGDSKSFNLRYIDWRNWNRNAFHVTAEFSVERTRSHETARPDIVLFVNGVPLAVMECKSPDLEIGQAVSQSIRNQRDEYIPKLFIYSQVVAGLNKNAAKFATVGTSAKFWSAWREKSDKDEEVFNFANKPLDQRQKDLLFQGEFASARKFFDALESDGHRSLTEQDRTIYSLLRPERLMELSYKFTIFDSGIKKIARYQQYFAVRRIIGRVKQFDADGTRQGGMVWHTQGSGKSLTMVWLARSLALDPDIPNPRVVLVTDRVDLDKQLGNTFAACGLDKHRAKTGRELLELVGEKKAAVVTSLVHKFDKALNVKKYQDDSINIFMLVDESHRSQFGSFSARMRQMFPRACYLGFTGTPLLKSEKNNFAKFGGLIDAYPMDLAVKDEAVVPLLYEGRHVEMEQNKKAVDLWFDRHTQELTKEQKADLKRKYARAEMLNKTAQVIYMRAFDVSEHFRANWQGTGFKAQLVAPGKAAALKYQEYLNEIGHVTSEVVISAPDGREGFEDVEEESKMEVIRFWEKMMKRYGSDEEYNKQIVNRFKFGDEPEILIVVDKLLTGFDAPRNSVLYLCRTLRDHALLQAIARVNRLFEDEETGARKDFGYILDYAGILGELDKALTAYAALRDFDEEDLRESLLSINKEVEKLPQRHSDLWDIFKEVKHRHDEEAYESILADEKLRHDFYERLADYAKTLGIALSSERFIMKVSDSKLAEYRNDLKRFIKLKASVKMRFAEAVDYREYEPKIKKLLDTHIMASEVYQLNEPVNIFDEKMFYQVKEEQGVYQTKTTAARADAIAHATKKAITERMEEDPAFYEKFSMLIQQAIDDFRAKRISDLEYLNVVSGIRDTVVTRRHEDIPDALNGNEDAMAFYGVILPFISGGVMNKVAAEKAASDAALAIHEIVKRNWKVNFIDDLDAQKRTENEIDDYLYDELKAKQKIDLTLEEMDEIIERSMRLARHRMPK